MTFFNKGMLILPYLINDLVIKLYKYKYTKLQINRWHGKDSILKIFINQRVIRVSIFVFENNLSPQDHPHTSRKEYHLFNPNDPIILKFISLV